MCRRSDWLCFVGSTSLTVHKELNQMIVDSRHIFTPSDRLTWENVGGGCYSVVSEYGPPFGLDGQCVVHALLSVSYVFSMLVVYVLVVYAWWWPWLKWCLHVKVDGVFLDVVVMSIGQLCPGYACQCLYVLCIHPCHTYLDYAYIDMVIVVVHEVMVCRRYGHDLIMVEMMFMYCYDYVYTCIILI